MMKEETSLSLTLEPRLIYLSVRNVEKVSYRNKSTRDSVGSGVETTSDE